MKSLKKLLALLLACLFLMGSVSLSVSATDTDDSIPDGVLSQTPGYGEGIYSVNSNARATNLLNRTDLTIAQVANHGLRVNYATGAVRTMAEIGGKDLTIQRWENNKWVTVCKADQIAKDRFFHSGSYYSPTGLPTGYYYRATMLHYAKEQGWFFPASQKFYNETTIILLQN